MNDSSKNHGDFNTIKSRWRLKKKLDSKDRFLLAVLIIYIVFFSSQTFLELYRNRQKVISKIDDGVIYNVSLKKIPRVYFVAPSGNRYSSSCREVKNKENQICLDKYSGDNFIGSDVYFLSFTNDRKINDGIILSGHFTNTRNGDVVILKTSELDVNNTKGYFQKTGMVTWWWLVLILPIFEILTKRIEDKDERS